jgi:hypothetical protein
LPVTIASGRPYLYCLLAFAAGCASSETAAVSPDAAAGADVGEPSGDGAGGIGEDPRGGGNRDAGRNDSGGDVPAGGDPSWTILIYGNGDNSLNWWLADTQQQLDKAQLGSRMHVVFLADYEPASSWAAARSTPPAPTGSSIRPGPTTW